MPYNAEISRTHPSAFLFLIDQSASMQDALDSAKIHPAERGVLGPEQPSALERTKAQGVSDAVNRLLRELTIKCAKSEGIRDYYHVGVIGYGGVTSSANRVESAFTGPLAGRELVPISEIANNPARIEERNKKVDDGAGGLVDQKVKFPVWFDPTAGGGTPMVAAFNKAASVLSGWVLRYPDSFPPICINISDGDSTDGDPSAPAEAVRALKTMDGAVLLFNIHISPAAGAPVEFPDSEESLSDPSAQLLFSLSSVLPPSMQAIARQEGLKVSETSKGFAFNADMVSLIRS